MIGITLGIKKFSPEFHVLRNKWWKEKSVLNILKPIRLIIIKNSIQHDEYQKKQKTKNKIEFVIGFTSTK